MDAELTERLQRGVELMTAFFNRQPGTGVIDEGLMRATLGYGVTDDDAIGALAGMVLVSELMMFHHQRVTGETPGEVLQLVAVNLKRHSEE